MKVHVVGGGPAGSVAAIAALRSGHDVVVSEEHSVAGIPQNCSGHFSCDGLESLRRFVDCRKLVINKIRGAHIHLGTERLSVRRHAPVSFVCDRAALDGELALRAEREGAKVNYGERISGHFHADNIIGADGPLSSVARHFSFPRIHRFAATMQAMVKHASPEPDMVEVHISNSLFPGFFAWVIPHDCDTAELGVGVELPHRPADAWRRLVGLKKVENAPAPKGSLIPLEPRAQAAKRVGRHSILLAGDAAGQVKATSGGGVVFGTGCAAIAGRRPDSPTLYEAEWRALFGPDLAIHSFIHDYLASRSDEELSGLGRRLKKLNCEDYLSRSGHMDRPTRMLHPQIIYHFIRNIAGVV